MARYYVNDNAQTDSGDHEVHVANCGWFDLIKSKTFLGDFASCGPAVTAAKRIYPQSNGCKHCCPACHTG